MIVKTGILGGTFDPVHNGHLALAEAAGKVCNLDEILLVPAALPPHKQNRKIVSFSQRVAMLDIALKDHPDLTVSTIEKLLPVPSYTIDTLHYLELHSITTLEFTFITGADTFLDILSWKNSEGLLNICDFLVFSRSGSADRYLKAFIKKLHYVKKDENRWEHPKTKKTIFHIDGNISSVSSSEVRKRLRKGKSVAHLVPPGVSEYIRKKTLYS